MSDLPLISIITINFNQPEITCELLASLSKINYRNTEIIVVDNASTTETSSISKNFPDVKLILSPRNLGFAGGNNLGIKEAKGKYILFLNNDTEVEPDFLLPIISLMESDSKIGMASPNIIYYGTDIIQYAGSEAINAFTGRGKKIGNKEKNIGQYNQIRETSLGHGAALMVSRKMIEKVGPMPEIFFLYYEEHDWCEAARRSGYKIFYVGTSKVYHKESMSVGKNNPIKTYYLTRNRLLYMRRNVFGFKLFVSILFFLLIATPKNAFVFLLKGEKKHFKAFTDALLWHISNLNFQGRKTANKKNEDVALYNVNG